MDNKYFLCVLRVSAMKRMFAYTPPGHSSVTQPSEAFFTSRMYLYSVPRVAL